MKNQHSKEVVKIVERQRKHCTTLYLMYKQPSGKRIQEATGLSYIPELTSADRKHNKLIQRAVDKLKAERTIAVFEGKVGTVIISRSQRKRLLVDYIRDLQKLSKRALGTRKHYLTLANKIEKFSPNIRLVDVDRRWLLSFFGSLNGLKDTSIKQYGTLLTAVFTQARRDKLIGHNPFEELGQDEKPKAKQTKRDFLTPVELNLLVSKFQTSTEKQKEALRMFLLACYTGLRYSDVATLKWDDIKSDISSGMYYFDIAMQKTGESVGQYLSQKALGLIGQPSNQIGYVFNKGVTNQYVRDCLKKAVEASGIRKHVTFHTARHTFAVNMLAKNRNVYEVSRLLGHMDVKTTQIYLDMLPDKQIAAANMIDEIF